ncbi:hypothetical protein ACQP1V_38820 [Microtetraspora malaysiensis]|uniref:hypothetical protein n=1 Tax=Microtetraspora malaysiensis TaxID=161358 RepID=UPI003D8E8823
MEHGKRPRARHAGDPVGIEEGDGRIVIRRHRSRFDDVVGTLPGFTEAMDVEAERDGWD